MGTVVLCRHEKQRGHVTAITTSAGAVWMGQGMMDGMVASLKTFSNLARDTAHVLREDSGHRSRPLPCQAGVWKWLLSHRNKLAL